MPLIDPVGRKSWRTRTLFACMYFLLIAGGITMVYPLMVMVTAAMTSSVDYNDFSPYPRYLTDETSLYQKFAHEKYNFGYRASLPGINQQYGLTLLLNEELQLPTAAPATLTRVTDDWLSVRAKLPPTYFACGFSKSGYEVGRAQILYQHAIEKEFGGDIRKFNRRFHQAEDNFSTIYGPAEQPLSEAWVPDDTELAVKWQNFVKTQLPNYYQYVPSCDGLWQQFLSDRTHDNIEAINRKLGTHASDFGQLMLQPTYQEAGPFAALWLQFVVPPGGDSAAIQLPIRYVTLPADAASDYRGYLKTTYHSIKKLNAIYGSHFVDFAAVLPPRDLSGENNLLVLQDVQNFLRTSPAVAKRVTLVTPGIRYRNYLRQQYGSIARLNTSYNTTYEAFADVAVPHALMDLRELRTHHADWRWYFVSRNFILVWHYITQQNGALINTLFYCAAAILTALTVNPLCAYALSRFKLSYANNILLFLLATMAFPAEVAMIPNFLLLRDFNLLNTYAALILPGMANGFSIFLLKGFFDSLPEELFEAATIDGAGEMRIFAQISMPLCKPVLAYLALGAFTGAYQAFMFAMIVCPDPKRWTIMVYLYDMASWATPSMQMAGMVIASIPTLLIFVMAQRVIMQGIVIPMDK